MENIFKNAYFGKSYKTRDGRKAIYITHADDRYDIALEGSCGTFSFLLRGGILISYANYDTIYERRCIDTMIDSDIISEWTEEDDKNKLENLADEYAENRWNSYAMVERQVFKAACRNIIMEKNIFEGAYFGKAYRTIDGRKAIYITHADDRYEIALEGSSGTFPFVLRDGILVSNVNIYNRRYIDAMTDSDIISEWQEERT